MAGEVVGVVLAAGASRRFGSPKQLLPLGDSTLLGQVVRNAGASRLDRVVVVLGREAERVRATVSFGRSRAIDNTGYAAGCASSLLAGLDAAADCAAIALLLGDQPGVSTPMIDQVVSAWRRRRPWGQLTSYRGEPGHPFLFAREAFATLRLLHGDKAVWRLLAESPGRIDRVELDHPLPPDIDTPEDYDEVRRSWSAAGGSS